MLYLYDIRKILRRYSPTWFRWPENQSFAYALCRRLVTLDVWFGRLRADVVNEWGYNGLLHGLEWALNDHFDPVQRRIWIESPQQRPYLFYRSVEGMPTVRFRSAGDPSAYSIMSAQQLAAALPYRYEFTINVPSLLGITAKAVFEYADLYRFAGRRPCVITRGPFNAIYGMDYYDQYNG